MNIKNIVLATAISALTPSIASADFLNNWQMDADKDGNYVTVNEYLDLTGNSYIENTFSDATNFTFHDNGFFEIAGVDGGGFTSLSDGPSDGTFPSRDLTAMFTGATGFGVLGGDLKFDSGASLELFSDTAFNYGSTTGIYGANDGDSIASFTLVSGSGIVGADAVPNGLITLIFEATALDAGVFLDESGNDLADLIDPLNPLLFGFVTTNASIVANPTTTLVNELNQIPGVTVSTPATSTPNTLLVSNNGQYRFSTVPEPTSLALLGLGLLGFAASRKKA